MNKLTFESMRFINESKVDEYYKKYGLKFIKRFFFDILKSKYITNNFINKYWNIYFNNCTNYSYMISIMNDNLKKETDNFKIKFYKKYITEFVILKKETDKLSKMYY